MGMIRRNLAERVTDFSSFDILLSCIDGDSFRANGIDLFVHYVGYTEKTKQKPNKKMNADERSVGEVHKQKKTTEYLYPFLFSFCSKGQHIKFQKVERDKPSQKKQKQRNSFVGRRPYPGLK
jgi:hypothetical protein